MVDSVNSNQATSTSLATSRVFSERALEALRRDIAAAFSANTHGVQCVVAAGSLGRLEASAASDVDAIVIARDESSATRACIAKLQTIITDNGFKAPKTAGIYAQPILLEDILARSARGSLGESQTVFGSRMQLLLDGRWLFAQTAFDEVREQVVDWYAGDNPSESNWTHLFNDLARYLHAYAVWQQFKYSGTTDDAWALRQAKFRSTRIVTFAGLFFLLAESMTRERGRDRWLRSQLARTPIERIEFIFAIYGAAEISQVLTCYETLHSRLCDPCVRADLVASPGPEDRSLTSKLSPPYAEIHALSGEMMDYLTQFILNRRDDWPLRAFRNWLL